MTRRLLVALLFCVGCSHDYSSLDGSMHDDAGPHPGVDAGDASATPQDAATSELGRTDASVDASVDFGPPGGATCTATSGSLTLRASTTRTTGISPLLVFFDATATTDTALTGSTTAFQDVYYSWNFGDAGASGTGTWAYGSNPGKNSRNTATGGIAAHLYITPSGDVTYAVSVTAFDGTNTASCKLGVTASDPSGASGFPGTKTTCVSASSTPTAGSGGCPAGASVLQTSNFNTALSSSNIGNGKRVLFKCGDTFTGDSASVSAIEWSVGAYGGCEGTQTNRPIINDNGNGSQLSIAVASGDGRVADLDFHGTGSNSGGAVLIPAGTNIVPYEITLTNLSSTANTYSYSTPQGHEVGIIDSVQHGEKNIGMFLNNGGNNPKTWSGPKPNDDYQALMGDLFDGTGVADNEGIEVIRIAACRLCVIENNTIENANNVGAVLKLHNGNPGSGGTWSGVYTELVEIADNAFAGKSGAQLVENAPQNESTDERLRNIVVERNTFAGVDGIGLGLLVCAVNETVRDNVFFTASGQASPALYGVQVGRRGIEPVASAVELYNNTCYMLSGKSNQACVAFSGGAPLEGPGVNSFAKNNLFYTPQSGLTTILDQGTGNMVSNNTTTPTANPSITNASGKYNAITDFKPTASDSGGTMVPNWRDALGVAWSPTWSLGAIHP